MEKPCNIFLVGKVGFGCFVALRPSQQLWSSRDRLINHFTINLHECMGPGSDRNRGPGSAFRYASVATAQRSPVRTSDILNEGLLIKMARKKFQRKR